MGNNVKDSRCERSHVYYNRLFINSIRNKRQRPSR